MSSSNSVCCRKLPASAVWTGYFISIALVCAGLSASVHDMYYLVRITDCAPGTSDKFPPPAGVPYCNRDAWRSSTDRAAQAFGTSSTSFVDYSTFTGNGRQLLAYYCPPNAKNSTCSVQSKMPYSSGSPQMRVTDMFYQLPSGLPCDPAASVKGCAAVFQIQAQEKNNFMLSMSGLLTSFLAGPSSNHFNNIPVKFFAQALPAGLSSSTTYYLRSHGSGFAVASSLSEAPLASITKPVVMPQDIVIAMPAFNSCPFQSKLPTFSSSNLNADGSIKTGACGYCLSQDQSTNMNAATSTASLAVVFLALILIFTRFQFFCKMRFFKAFVVIFSVLAWLCLLATVAVGFFAALSVGACSSLISEPLPSNDISSIFALTPNGLPKVNDYTPVTAKSVPDNTFAIQASPAANFQCRTSNGVACYNTPYFIPGPGTIFYIVAIVYLLLFLIFVGIKVDFSISATSSGNAMVSAYAKPIPAGISPGRDVYL